MIRLLLTIAVLATAGVASAAPPLHPNAPPLHHRHILSLCNRGTITFDGLPKGSVAVATDEWVNGYEITAWMQTPHITWFFGKGVSGRIITTGTTMRVKVAHHDPGCVRFVVAWWLA